MYEEWKDVSHIDCPKSNITVAANISLEERCRLTTCPYNNGYDVLAYSGITESDVQPSFIALIVIMVSLHVIALCALLLRATYGSKGFMNVLRGKFCK